MFAGLRIRGKARHTCLAFIVLAILSLICRYYFERENTSQLQHIDRLDKPPSIFIAANLRNNARILHNWVKQVELLIQWAGPSRVFISIYENGSEDETKSILKEWQQHLSRNNIAHKIVMEELTSIKAVRRIPRLAKIRNEALKPLYSQPEKFDRLLFLNDISFRAEDAIELLNTNEGNYDAACGLDFFGEFYDIFATREVDGGWVGSGNYPYFADKTSRELLQANKPVPVYSCWNGMVVFRTDPFVERDNKLGFRAILPDEPDPPLEASECCLIFTDLRTRNYTHIYINPKVKVAYDHFHYWYASHILPLWKPYLSWINHPNRHAPDEAWSNVVKEAISMGADPGDQYCFWPQRSI